MAITTVGSIPNIVRNFSNVLDVSNLKITALLSNKESLAVPTDENGNNEVFTQAVATFSVREGSTNVTASWTLSLDSSTNCSVTVSDINKNATVTAMTADTASFIVKAVRTNYNTIYKTITVFKSKEGATGPQGETGDTGATGATGPQGDPGADGADGVGIPVGGTTGQVLSKASATDYDTEWVDKSITTLTSYSVVEPATGYMAVKHYGVSATTSGTGSFDLYFGGANYLPLTTNSPLTAKPGAVVLELLLNIVNVTYPAVGGTPSDTYTTKLKIVSKRGYADSQFQAPSSYSIYADGDAISNLTITPSIGTYLGVLPVLYVRVSGVANEDYYINGHAKYTITYQDYN